MLIIMLRSKRFIMGLPGGRRKTILLLWRGMNKLPSWGNLARHARVRPPSSHAADLAAWVDALYKRTRRRHCEHPQEACPANASVGSTNGITPVLEWLTATQASTIRAPSGAASYRHCRA